MDVSRIGGAGLSGTTANSDSLRQAVTAVNRLNNANIVDREFAVVRDPATQRFVVLVRERSTGTVLDQIPAESIVRMMAQFSPGVSESPVKPDQ
jgi:uncharacterized FlaG/YvyC family protein